MTKDLEVKIMNKEEFDMLVNDILKIPQPKEELPVSAMASINVEELRQVIEAFNKIPDYNLLIKDNLKKDKEIQKLTNNWNKLEELIDEEKTRLAKECSHTYEDSLGKTIYVNEDIFNELNNILDKMNEIKEKNNEK